MSGMEQFYTRDRANEGRRVDLRAPDGSATAHWIQIRHVWCDAFAEAEEAAKLRVAEYVRAELAERQLPDDAKMPDDLKAGIKRETKEAQLDMLAALVSGWSFDKECTQDNVREFLQMAPQVAEQVNRIAGDTRRFFGEGSGKSKPGSGKKKS